MNGRLGLGFGLREVFGEKTEDRQFLARAVGDRMWPMPKKKFGKTKFSHIGEEQEAKEEEDSERKHLFCPRRSRTSDVVVSPVSIICNLYVGAVLFSAFDNDQARLLLEGKK